ncbi:ribonuclease P/MRP protein subunit POP5-like isoform X2 [Branchiostoma floridae]|uniref:Ribonuclease P/MRP protein subunit POP5-like isoform X2 n=1 Tax=Branchiostoma floridae TaxID=7739 RepID=A0A9J7N5L7_BRAFL|nr:ribonuclease P/MRP protein subunit POP5-like isoform X2 [Branchiostoma floridae]
MVRFKHRYVLAELVFGNDLLVYNVTQRVVYAAVRDIIEQLHGGYGIGLFTPGMSGSIKACQKWLVQHNRQVLPTLLLRCTSEEEKSRMRKSIFDSTIVKEEPWTEGKNDT